MQADDQTNRHVIVAGHSHMFAMGVHQRYQGPIALLRFDGRRRPVSFLMEEWKGNRTNDYWDALVNLSADRSVLIVFNGNQHYADFLLAPDPLIDFVDDSDSAIHSGAMAVPRRLVKAHFEPTLAQLRTIIERLHGSGCRFVAVLGTPAPKSDITRFVAMIRQSRYFAGVAQRQGLDLATVATTPPRILLKMWRVIQELLAEVAADKGATFVSVPPETMDGSGFLHERCYASTGKEGDITHANEEYGRLMLDRGLRTVAENVGD